MNCVLKISLEHKAFLWLQAKTATSLAARVFQNFGFKNFSIIENKPNFSQEIKGHFHSPCFFEGHEKYTFISTIRNPYEQVFSEFPKRGNETINDFRNHLERKYQLDLNELSNFMTYSTRLPDYIIRVDKLIEDYLSIPFVSQSYFATSGQLKKLIDSKVNETKVKLNWKDFYDQNIADLVYYNSSKYFNLFGYDKNSWKK